MPTIRLPNGWNPRDYQLPLWKALEQGKKRADVAWHRRAGKDDVALHWTSCAAHQRVGTYWHMLPEANQARKAIWEATNPHTGIRRIDEAFPEALRARTVNDEMFMRLRCGSSWQVVGSDNYNSLVGSPPIGIVFSEWSLAKPDAWTYLRPILEENGGWALFIWTPRGRNHAVQAFESRERDSETWFTQRLPATDTGVFTPEQLAKERADYIAECGSEEEGDAKFRQEYLVDFNAAVPGSYFGTAISEAQDTGRIGSFPHDDKFKVCTSWDIGVDDYTAIWFFQVNGLNVRAIDYHETSGEGAPQIAAVLKDKPYRYDKHYLPHDVSVREWGIGAKTRRETLDDLGIKPVYVGVAMDPADRINAARRLMPLVSFDAVKCRTGLERLRNYKRRWNSSMLVFGGPQHDESSHGADAFGEFAVNCGIKAPKVILNKPITGIHELTFAQALKAAPKRPANARI